MLKGLSQREVRAQLGGMDSDSSIESGGGVVYYNLLSSGSDGLSVRYGFKKRYTIGDVNYVPLRCWAAPNADDTLVIYARRRIGDAKVQSIVYNTEAGTLEVVFSESNHVLKYYGVGNKITLSYKIGETPLQEITVTVASLDLQGNRAIITFTPLIFTEEVSIQALFYDDGAIIECNFSTPHYLILHEGLSPYCSPQGLPYGDVLLITNNKDDMLVYQYKPENASSCNFVEQKVKENIEPGKEIAWNQNETPNKVLFVCETASFANKWRTMQHCWIDGKTYEIQSYDIADKTVNLTLSEALTKKPSAVYFIRRPPKSKKIFAYHKKLFLIVGDGLLNAAPKQEDMRIYYTNIASDYTSWVDEKTQEYNYEDTQIHAVEHDWYEDILEFGGYLYFAGRKKTQIWKWDADKGVLGGFVENIDCGVYKTGFFSKIRNTLYSLQASGFRQWSIFNILTHPEIQVCTKINSFVKEEIKHITQDFYYCAEVCDYKRGNLILYKIANGRFLVGDYKDGWAFTIYESSLFFDCTLCLCKESLFVLQGNDIYEYCDGLNGEDPCFTDDGAAINCIWQQTLGGSGLSNWMNYRVYCNITAKQLEEDKSLKLKITSLNTIGKKAEVEVFLTKTDNILYPEDNTSKNFYFGLGAFVYSTYCKMYFNKINFEISCLTDYDFKIHSLIFLGNRCNILGG